MMSEEPRYSSDYSERQVEAARRVLVDVHQVLASFADCMVVVGGWVPDLLISEAEEKHVGSIDVDVALAAEKLADGRYAELLSMLLDTRRYTQGKKAFQLVTKVDLGDGKSSVVVPVDFLAAQEVKLKRRRDKRIKGFRILQADGCDSAFRAPHELTVEGVMVNGAENTVGVFVAAIPDFIIMKAYALAGRDKPKDAYDLCYCLEHLPDGIRELGMNWKGRKSEDDVRRAIEILREKFSSINSYGPQQVAEFHQSVNEDEREIQARTAFELVRRFLEIADG